MTRVLVKFLCQHALIPSLLLVNLCGATLGMVADASRAAPTARGAPGSASAKQRTPENPAPEITPPSPLSRKQKKDLLKSNIEKMKHDADELVALTKSLQEEVNSSNANVLSLKIVDTAEKIERLARKIRNAARGN